MFKMSATLQRIQNSNVLYKLHFPIRECGLNLNRQFSFFTTFDRNSDFLDAKCHRVPSRSFYKHEIEVKKRIQWQRPVKVPCILPEKSGDLSGLPELDLNKPPPLFDQSSEYQSANKYVKAILSLKFQYPSFLRECKIKAVTDQVKRHNLDTNSVEVKIAKYTAIIRNMQVHYSKFPRDKKARADLKEIIEFRKKRMKLLRSLDYRRFEWLLEQLDLLYKPAPTSHERVERKKSMRWLAQEYIDNFKQQKLNEYREKLDSQKQGFLEKKLAVMLSIVEEEKSFNVEPSFTSGDIAQVEEELNKLKREEGKDRSASEVVKEVY
ncbi:hypothetical protein ONE63_002033 [Megalurothrips usitatus]|uniref:Small ribosomal subunit protein uS15m n=1 Tax=Megalurothrips usitatus TaxID=439358 RepID=A0AAV7XA54_9NEOP|nr:hypothetical protein ONE63_002033 [Megalurothrips usitatus]